jgi:hypothetical protein
VEHFEIDESGSKSSRIERKKSAEWAFSKGGGRLNVWGAEF